MGSTDLADGEYPAKICNILADSANQSAENGSRRRCSSLATVIEYIRNQEAEEDRHEQLRLRMPL